MRQYHGVVCSIFQSQKRFPDSTVEVVICMGCSDFIPAEAIAHAKALLGKDLAGTERRLARSELRQERAGGPDHTGSPAPDKDSV